MERYYVELMSIVGINVLVCYEVNHANRAKWLHSAVIAETNEPVDVNRLEPILGIFERIFPDTYNLRFDAWLEEQTASSGV